MKLSQRYFYLIFPLLISFAAACSSAPTTNSNSNATVISNSGIVNATITNATATPTPSATPAVAANAGSPSATVAAYYQAMVKKDEKGFRQVLSKATLSEFSADATAEGEKTLVGYWVSYSAPPKQTYETRNERISGDVALLEIKNSDTGEWFLTKLVRENGEWKLDQTSATLESLRKQQLKQ